MRGSTAAVGAALTKLMEPRKEINRGANMIVSDRGLIGSGEGGG